MPTEAAKRLPWLKQYLLVLRLQYTDYKDSALMLVVFGLVMPLGMLWILGGYMPTKGGAAHWLLAGNAVIAVTFGSTNFILWRVGMLRLNRSIDFYASLPIHRTAFVASLFTMSQMAALPALVVSLIAGAVYLQIPATNLLPAIPLALLAAASLTIIGAAAGSYARTQGHLNLYSNFIYLLVMFASPAMMPLERLPLPMQVTSHLLPPGQAILALTDALSGNFGLRFWVLTLVLCAWLLVMGTYGLKRLDFRAD